jgi:hypothetical protein
MLALLMVTRQNAKMAAEDAASYPRVLERHLKEIEPQMVGLRQRLARVSKPEVTKPERDPEEGSLLDTLGSLRR